MEITPYSGEQPYIFISYPHRDADRVLPIVAGLMENGFRVWYDEGIVPGKEWDYDIATHLNNCSFVIAFISKAYLESENCKDELNYARDLNKPRLLIYLENVELPAGMAMRLNRLQAINWYSYADKKKAMEKVMQADQIELCREKIEKAADGDEKSLNPADSKAQIWKQKWFIPAICALAVVAVALAFVLRKEPAPVEVATPVPAETAAPVEEEPEVITDVHIMLTAPETMGVKSFESSVATIRDRLDILCGELGYSMEIKSDTLDITLPDKAFRGMDVMTLLRCYISRPCNTYLFDRGEQNRSFAIAPDKIQSAVLEHGTIDGLDAEEAEYDYLRVTFTESFAAELEGCSQIKLGQDMDYSGYYFFDGVMSEDGTQYLLYDSDWKKGNMLQLVAYNLTHDRLSNGFYFRNDIVAYWDDLDDGENHGKNQCAPEALPDEIVTLSYIPDTSDAKKGELLDTRDAVLARLDKLDCPYAFGTGDEENSLVLRMPQERYVSWLIDCIFDRYIPNNFVIGRGITGASVRYDSHTLVTQDGKTGIQLEIKSGSREDILARLDKMQDSDKPLIVQLGSLSDCQLENAQIEYDDTYLTIWMDGEQQWILRALDEILDLGSEVPYKLSSSQTQGSEEKIYVPHAAEFEELKATFNQLLPDADVSQDNTDVCVFLNLPKDDELVETTLQSAADLFELMGMENGNFGRLIVYGCEENNGVMERCRLIFRRIIGTSDSYPGEIDVIGAFCNGFMANRKEEVIAAANEIPLYEQLGANPAGWIYGF